jgi:hypothetical protein
MSAPELGKRRKPLGSGRKRGTPNRATQTMRDLFADLDYDPAVELTNIARDPKTPLDTRVQIHLGILPYLYPKRRPVGSTQEPTTTTVITTLDNPDDCSNAPGDSASAS